VSVVVPVNAQGDIPIALRLLGDLAAYAGPHRLETLFLVNNFPVGQPPPEVRELTDRGARVEAVPNVRREGYTVIINARAHGVRAATNELQILFDADCRVPRPTELVNWYVRALDDGADAAYTAVGHHELWPGVTPRIRIVLHHAGRWVKRVVFRVPTMRGSNYAVRRSAFLRLFDRGEIVHDLDVGPAFKAAGARIAYSGASELRVFTSGRNLRPGWMRLIRFVPKRIARNVRVVLRRS
jgi:Glycosyltransferase like family 2